MDDDPELPWGFLPIEQYLIVCHIHIVLVDIQLPTRALQYDWDYSATKSPTEQRLQLLRKFIDLDEFPKVWMLVDSYSDLHRIPTAAEVDTILRP